MTLSVTIAIPAAWAARYRAAGWQIGPEIPRAPGQIWVRATFPGRPVYP